MAASARLRESKQVFTTTQVGRICGVSQQAVIKWIDSGRLAGYHLPNSRARRVTREALLKFMQQNDLPARSIDRDILKVLVVDDEEIVADMVVMEFEDDPKVEVRKALRGFDAGIIMDYRPDVVIVILAGYHSARHGRQARVRTHTRRRRRAGCADYRRVRIRGVAEC